MFNTKVKQNYSSIGSAYYEPGTILPIGKVRIDDFWLHAEQGRKPDKRGSSENDRIFLLSAAVKQPKVTAKLVCEFAICLFLSEGNLYPSGTKSGMLRSFLKACRELGIDEALNKYPDYKRKEPERYIKISGDGTVFLKRVKAPLSFLDLADMYLYACDHIKGFSPEVWRC